MLVREFHITCGLVLLTSLQSDQSKLTVIFVKRHQDINNLTTTYCCPSHLSILSHHGLFHFYSSICIHWTWTSSWLDRLLIETLHNIGSGRVSLSIHLWFVRSDSVGITTFQVEKFWYDAKQLDSFLQRQTDNVRWLNILNGLITLESHSNFAYVVITHIVCQGIAFKILICLVV